MGKEIKNILVINQPLGNRGDESAHRALMRGLNRKFPDAKITVLFPLDLKGKSNTMKVEHPNNEYVVINHPHDYRMSVLMRLLLMCHVTRIGTFLHPFLRKLVPFYKCADLVICAPGGICMGGFQNWLHVYMLYLAKLFHKKLVYYSRSFGPFPTATYCNRVFKRYSVEMLHYFEFLSIRDAKTMQLADELGLSYVSSIDTAFLDTPQERIPQEVQNQLNEEYMVFVPNSLTWHYAYKTVPQERIDTFYLHLMDEICRLYPNLQIVMLPQLYGYGEDKGDFYYFQKLKEQSLHKERIVVLSDTCSSDVQQSIIRQSQFVIGARYHSIVFAINNAVPFIALNYEHKMDGLLEILQLQEFGVDLKSVLSSGQSFVELLDDNLKKKEAVEMARSKAKCVAEECFSRFYRGVI